MHQAVGIFYVRLGKATSILVEIELSFNVQQAKGVCLCVKSCHTPSLVISDEFLLLTITREVILRLFLPISGSNRFSHRKLRYFVPLLIFEFYR